MLKTAKVTINYSNDPVSLITTVPTDVARIIEDGWFKNPRVARVIRDGWDEERTTFTYRRACYVDHDVSCVEIQY